MADDPSPYDIQKAFGSWKAAQLICFGKAEPFKLPPRPDPTYIINTVVDCDLWKRDAYQDAHRRQPDLVYSTYWVIALFGSWDRLRWAAEQVSMKASLSRWMALRRRLGSSPTMEELNRAGISLDPLRRIYGTRAELKEFLAGLGRQIDKQESASARKSSDTSQANMPSHDGEHPDSERLPTAETNTAISV